LPGLVCWKAWTYASNLSNENLNISENQAMMQQMAAVGTKFGEAAAFFEPEILQIPKEKIEKFIYEKASLQEGGKFSNDFRITAWGRLFRKLWIDELPMLINFFKRQLKLVGVRPLSIHYFSLYPDHVKERRIKYKPGLVPPFYADLPKTFDEIISSEIKYLNAYEKHPILTDVKYFFRAAYNIIFNNARSE